MKKTCFKEHSIGVFKYSLFLLLLTYYSTTFAQQPITFTRDQAMVLTPGDENFMNMFDGNNSTVWFPGYDKGVYPAQSLVDLKNIYNITKINIWNFQGSRLFKVYAGSDPFNLPLVINANLTLYNQGTDFTINTAGVRYIKFELPTDKSDSPSEVRIYGSLITASTEPAPTGTPRAQNNVSGVFGVNSFGWVNPSIETPFTGIREYIDLDWIQNQDGQYRFNPANSAIGMYDDHLADLKSRGMEVLPVLQSNLPWTRTSTYNDKDYKPVYPVTANPAIPASYAKQAAFHFQFAARYGYTVVDNSKLLIDPTPRWTNDPVNVKKSGLKYIKYFECWNEPDKNWKTSNGYFSPFEFAAYISAVADGHCNTIPGNVGIKNADPTAKIVMGGLVNLSVDYVKAMVLWFKTYRPDKTVPVDVFNFHHYSNSADAQHVTTSKGISPEQDLLRQKIATIKNYVDLYLPGKEIYLSEFGYDSNVGSSQRTEPIGSMSRREVQGIWNIRTLLEVMASQIDKSHVYMIYDEAGDDTGGGVYKNSGVVDNLYNKKQAWYYINTVKTLLKNYKYIADESTSSVKRYKFTNGTTTIYALWLPSSSDASTAYTLSLPGSTSVALVTLLHLSDLGSRSTKPVSNGSLSLTVSERPIFVVVGPTTTTSPVSISIPSPTENQNFIAGTKVTIKANASTTSGTITSVKFYKVTSTGNVYIGEDTYSSATDYYYDMYPANLNSGVNTFMATAITTTGLNNSATVRFNVTTSRFGEEIEGLNATDVYPNPIHQGDLTFNAKALEYSLTNSSGKVVREGKNADKVNVDGLIPGIYLLILDGKPNKIVLQ